MGRLQGISLLVVFSFVIPLIIRSNQGTRSPLVHANATESLNFQLTWLLISAIAIVLSLITLGLGFLLVFPLSIGAMIFMIIVMIKATGAAKRGETYRYPLCIRFL